MVVINELSNKNINNILQIYPNETTFYFENGDYELTEQLNINKPNIRLIGLSGDAKDVHIHQTIVDNNGLNITADNIVINYLSIHVEEGEGVCLSHANANWSNIENCHFYGSNTNFTVYFAGPSVNAGQDTIDGFLNDHLDMHNVFDNNIVYTRWEGDAISFSLQKYGSVRDNIVRGGKIAIYMVKQCLVTSNSLYDSSAHGIICSLPSHDLSIENNYIRNSASASINVSLQIEHGLFINENHGIVIRNNKIENSGYIGIEINNANNIIIENNNIKWTKQFGLYILKSSNIHIKNNNISQFTRGIHMDVDSSENIVEHNRLYSVYPNISEHAIVLESMVNHCTINENHISGKFISSQIKDIGSDNIVTSNITDDHHTYHDEILII
jgi:parallel beta-helix repeat protein